MKDMIVLLTIMVMVGVSGIGTAIVDEEISSETAIDVPIGDETKSPKITEGKKEILIDISEQWLMKNGSREYVKKEFTYLGGSRSMDIIQHEYEITCYATSTLLDRYHFTAEESVTTTDIKISSVTGPLTEDLTATPLPTRMLLDEEEKLPDTDEERKAMGDLNLGILTIVLIAFACIYKRRLYK